MGHWTFDGQDTNWGANTTDDVSPNSNIGTMTNMSITTSPVPGVAGQALNFDGTNDYVNAGNGSNLNLTGSMTISAWVYSKSSGSEQQQIVSKIGGPGCGSQTPYDFSITDTNKLRYYEDNGNDCGNTDSINSISLNQWQHVVFIRNASNQIIFYINSSQDLISGSSLGVGDSGAPVNIGRRSIPDMGYSFFNGYIDEVRIYNRALSGSEVTELYNMGR